MDVFKTQKFRIFCKCFNSVYLSTEKLPFDFQEGAMDWNLLEIKELKERRDQLLGQIAINNGNIENQKKILACLGWKNGDKKSNIAKAKDVVSQVKNYITQNDQLLNGTCFENDKATDYNARVQVPEFEAINDQCDKVLEFANSRLSQVEDTLTEVASEMVNLRNRVQRLAGKFRKSANNESNSSSSLMEQRSGTDSGRSGNGDDNQEIPQQRPRRNVKRKTSYYESDLSSPERLSSPEPETKLKVRKARKKPEVVFIGVKKKRKPPTFTFSQPPKPTVEEVPKQVTMSEIKIEIDEVPHDDTDDMQGHTEGNEPTDGLSSQSANGTQENENEEELGTPAEELSWQDLSAEYERLSSKIPVRDTSLNISMSSTSGLNSSVSSSTFAPSPFAYPVTPKARNTPVAASPAQFGSQNRRKLFKIKIKEKSGDDNEDASQLSQPSSQASSSCSN